MSETAAQYAKAAARYLDASVDDVSFRGGMFANTDRKDNDPVRLLLALHGIGQALLAIDGRLADAVVAASSLQGAVEDLGALRDMPGSRRARFRMLPRRRATAGVKA